MLPWKCRTNKKIYHCENWTSENLFYTWFASHSCNFVYIELWEIFYLWILLTNPIAHFSSGIVVWPTRSVPWCSARHTTRLGFPVPLETAPIGIRFFPCPPIIERHLNVEDVTSWPYSDFIDAWLPLPNTKRIDWNNVMPKMQIYFLCFILVSCIFLWFFIFYILRYYFLLPPWASLSSTRKWLFST